ncbi:hypothetical protein U1Q18_037569 [Sarracenia purpurea var. burkii]
MLFVAKYGKEFVSAATELMPECGVNRQLIELLSVRAPDPEVKLKLLKEIAEEHELDWDPAASETALWKLYEDLLNGPTQLVSRSKLPLPKERNDEPLYSASEQSPNEWSDSDAGFGKEDFESVKNADANEINLEPDKGLEEQSAANYYTESPKIPIGSMEDKQFVPFISPPSLTSKTFSVRESDPPLPLSGTKSEANADLQDVLVAAQTAAESAERAATAARSAASLAQVRINELIKKKSVANISDGGNENPFHEDTHQSETTDNKPNLLFHQNSSDKTGGLLNSRTSNQDLENLSPYGNHRVEFDSSSPLSSNVSGHDTGRFQPQRLPSMDDESFFSYPNLFMHQDSNVGPGVQSLADNSRSTNEL